jgi:hypothetical protein
MIWLLHLCEESDPPLGMPLTYLCDGPWPASVKPLIHLCECSDHSLWRIRFTCMLALNHCSDNPDSPLCGTWPTSVMPQTQFYDAPDPILWCPWPNSMMPLTVIMMNTIYLHNFVGLDPPLWWPWPNSKTNLTHLCDVPDSAFWWTWLTSLVWPPRWTWSCIYPNPPV